MKIFVGILIGIILVLGIKTVYADNVGKVIATVDHRGTFDEDVFVSKVNDNNVSCYVATAKQQSSSIWLSGTMVSISCVKVK